MRAGGQIGLTWDPLHVLLELAREWGVEGSCRGGREG